jgi:hypothetical protein
MGERLKKLGKLDLKSATRHATLAAVRGGASNLIALASDLSDLWDVFDIADIAEVADASDAADAVSAGSAVCDACPGQPGVNILSALIHAPARCV